MKGILSQQQVEWLARYERRAELDNVLLAIRAGLFGSLIIRIVAGGFIGDLSDNGWFQIVVAWCFLSYAQGKFKRAWYRRKYRPVFT